MTKKGRRLSAEEEKLWKKIAETTTPMDRRVPFTKPDPKPISRKPKPALPAFRIGESLPASSTETRIVAPDQPLRMDRKTFARMKRGKSSPDARIDLHGMTVDRAHKALLAFLLRCHADDRRLALVITGKGKSSQDQGPIPQPTGILRRQVPHWLEQPPLRQIVLQTTTAHQKHGGSGALYVYLRR